MRCKTFLQVEVFFILFFSFFAARDLLAQQVTLRYGDTAGTTLNYDFSVNTPAPQASQKVTLTLTRDVSSVDAQEVMSVNTSFSNGSMIVNGVTYPFPIEGQILATRMTRRGEVIETVPMGSFSDLFAAAGIQNQLSVSTDIFRSLGVLEFPVQALSLGDAWTVDKSYIFPNGDSINFTYNYTLEEFVNYAGYDSAKIRISAEPTVSFYRDLPQLRRGILMKGKVKISGTLLFAYNEGRIVKLDETIETSTLGTVITYEGTAEVIPAYQKTTVLLEIK